MVQARPEPPLGRRRALLRRRHRRTASSTSAQFLSAIESLGRAVAFVVEAAAWGDPAAARRGDAPPGYARAAHDRRSSCRSTSRTSTRPSFPDRRTISELTEEADRGCSATRRRLRRRQPPPAARPTRSHIGRGCVRDVDRLRPVCDRYGMPLMVKPLAEFGAARAATSSTATVDKILTLVPFKRPSSGGRHQVRSHRRHPGVPSRGRDRERAARQLVRGSGRVDVETILVRTRVRRMAKGARSIDLRPQRRPVTPIPRAWSRRSMDVVGPPRKTALNSRTGRRPSGRLSAPYSPSCQPHGHCTARRSLRRRAGPSIAVARREGTVVRPFPPGSRTPRRRTGTTRPA